MYNFTSFDKDTFYKNMKEKNYSRLKTNVISCIRNNPAFRKAPGEECCEARIAMNLLQEHVPEMFGEYEVQVGERAYKADEAASWDRDDFIEQTFFLGENFCWERFRHLLKIGQKITEARGTNFHNPQKQDNTMLGNQAARPGIRQILYKIIEGIKGIVHRIMAASE